MKGQHGFPVLITIALVGALQACDLVPKPTADSTAPNISWSVLNENTNEERDFVDSQSFNAAQGESYTITLIVEDPEGVHKVSLVSSFTFSCASGNLVQQIGPSLGAPETQTFQPNNRGEVLTNVPLTRNVEVGPFDCQEGWTFKGGEITLSGSGENYFSGITRAELVIAVP